MSVGIGSFKIVYIRNLKCALREVSYFVMKSNFLKKNSNSILSFFLKKILLYCFLAKQLTLCPAHLSLCLAWRILVSFVGCPHDFCLVHSPELLLHICPMASERQCGIMHQAVWLGFESQVSDLGQTLLISIFLICKMGMMQILTLVELWKSNDNTCES